MLKSISYSVLDKCAEEPWCLITSHSQNVLENVPPKEVCYTFDSKRVCVA